MDALKPRHGGRLLAAGTAAAALLATSTAFAAPTSSPASTTPTSTTPASTTPISRAASGAAEPQIRLVAASDSVTLDRFEGEGVYLLLGTHIVAGRKPFEIWAQRTSYKDPIRATQVIHRTGGDRVVPLPDGMVNDFTGLADFTHLTIKDSAGTTVVERDEDFCPSGFDPVRTRPDAPDTTPYASGCASNPFTLGGVWGIQAGWGTPTSDPWEGDPADLEDGTYTATVTINPRYREIFKVSAAAATATVEMTVVTEDGSCEGPHGCVRPPEAAARAQQAASGPAPSPAPRRPTGPARVPKGPKPDLRSLPAWGIEMLDEEEKGAAPARQFLAFSATVWTAGRSPLVVDGFRRSDEDVMDAFQYFYDNKGEQVGYAPVGEMEWDARDGHDHWHFTDFAQYRLLDADKQVAVRSGKEAFCLANTDAVDYTLPKANWRPDNTDLHTACGDHTSLAVREVLEVGSGDTYAQFLPGQSFDITDLPNGTYYIEVAANPDKRLYEESTTNNISHRKVILGGKPGARTVKVPPHQGIDG
jgi:Lysyl oxidase